MTIFLFSILIAIALLGIPPHWSILAGLCISLILPQSEFFKQNGKKWSGNLLKLSVVLLGAGLNFRFVLKEGSEGLIVTAVSISAVFLIGIFLARVLKITSPLSTLITAGTSICGGSAIAALVPILKAQSLTVATALGIVFILNAFSVFLFPAVGDYLQLTQEQFGTWAALAIHDTSSVVAASQIYGEEALKFGTTLKLTRALWIIPLTLIFSQFKKSENKINIPWFVLLFLLMSLVFTFVPELSFMTPYLSILSKAGLSITLFLIGLDLNKKQLMEIGTKPILFGLLLWAITLTGSLLFVLYGLG